MSVEPSGAIAPGEHPLMSNKTLRAIYAGMVTARAHIQTSGSRLSAAQMASHADVACSVSCLVGLAKQDLALDCRSDGVLNRLQPIQSPLLVIPGAVSRLYAAIGAALPSRPPAHSRRIVLAFFERHELRNDNWTKAMQLASSLPILLVILPHWRGPHSDRDICREARTAGIPGIPVDADDAIALYRVFQESLVRARADGGAALIEAVRLPVTQAANRDPILHLAGYLLKRGVADETWIKRIAERPANTPSNAGPGAMPYKRAAEVH